VQGCKPANGNDQHVKSRNNKLHVPDDCWDELFPRSLGSLTPADCDNPYLIVLTGCQSSGELVAAFLGLFDAIFAGVKGIVHEVHELGEVEVLVGSVESWAVEDEVAPLSHGEVHKLLGVAERFSPVGLGSGVQLVTLAGNL
jgi:hypothetical protein